MDMDDATYERMLDEQQQLTDRMGAIDRVTTHGFTPYAVNLLRAQYAAMDAYHRILSLRIEHAMTGFKQKAAAQYSDLQGAQVLVGGGPRQYNTEDEYLANDRRTAALQLAIGYNSSVRDGMPPNEVIAAAEAFEDYLRGSHNRKQLAGKPAECEPGPANLLREASKAPAAKQGEKFVPGDQNRMRPPGFA